MSSPVTFVELLRPCYSQKAYYNKGDSSWWDGLPPWTSTGLSQVEPGVALLARRIVSFNLIS